MNLKLLNVVLTQMRRSFFTVAMLPILMLTGCTNSKDHEYINTTSFLEESSTDSANSWVQKDFTEDKNGEYILAIKIPKGDGTSLAAGTLSNTIIPHDYITNGEIKPARKKSCTIMIYMNGSDLESDDGSATDDIYEMLDSEFNSEEINILLFAGGSNEWQNDTIPADDNSIYLLEDEELILLASTGLNSMGNPQVLAGFINFGYNLFPADHYGIILWDHGGGAVVGYGPDERFDDIDEGIMTLAGLDSAFASTAMPGKFEFIGFDTCLLATLEMACVTSKYANYLIASEELVPGYGWDYTFLGDINEHSGYSGRNIGKMIVDYYGEFYQDEDITTLSLIYLAEVGIVADEFERLAIAAGKALTEGEYKTISKARKDSREFGKSSPKSSDGTDMIDIWQLAYNLKEILPDESSGVINALDKAVLYQHMNNISGVGGLTVYFPFSSTKELLDEYLPIYSEINVLPEYTQFIHSYANELTGDEYDVYYENIAEIMPQEDSEGNYEIKLTKDQLDNMAEIYFTVWQHEENIAPGLDYYVQFGESSEVVIGADGTVKTEFEGRWTTLNDYWVCLYEIDSNEQQTRYAIPAELNGEDVDLIAVYDNKTPEGRIIGAIPDSSDYNIPAKNMLKINKGDKIMLYYYAMLFTTDDADIGDFETEIWYYGEEFTVKGELKLEKQTVDEGEYLYGFTMIDWKQNVRETDFIIVEIYE